MQDAANNQASGTPFSARSELVFGGTFDPPHLGHLALIEKLLNRFKGCTLRLIPCATPPLKHGAYAGFEQRQQMLALGLSEKLPQFSERVIIDEREAKRDRPSYTLETLAELRKQWPNKRWIWVMGADAACELERWWRWQSLKDYCHLLVFNRCGYDLQLAAATLQAAGFTGTADLAEREEREGFFQLFDDFAWPLSSTRVRQAIQENESTDELVAPSVIKYIRQRQLYLPTP